MGDMADYYYDLALQDNWDDDFDEEYDRFEYWNTKEGTKVKVINMTNTHIQNTINMLMRNNPTSKWIEVLAEEQTRRVNTQQ